MLTQNVHCEDSITAININFFKDYFLFFKDPVTVFGELVAGLPPPDSNMQDVIYHYKKQLEQRQVQVQEEINN